MVDLVCASCHRQERWERQGDALTRVDVLVEGGQRRPNGDPQWVRGRTAVASFEGTIGPVVEVCEACGQLMTAEDRSLPRMSVRVDTPLGALTIAETIEGPEGAMTPEEASEWLEDQYYVPVTRGLGGDLLRTMMFLVLIPPFLVWLGAMLFVVSFLRSVIEGPPEFVRNTPGYDLTIGAPAEQPAEQSDEADPSSPKE